jgi:3-deoxy-D-manno-octulosonic-acid transferase
MILALPMLIYRLFREKGFDERLRQSVGILSPDTLEKVANKDAIWLHAASVGEIVATSPIVKEIRREMPNSTIMVSVVTTHGYMMAERIITEVDGIIFFPFDLPYLSYSVVKRIRPRVLLLVETELWPNFLKTARHFKIPVVMVNGRISEKSLNGYTYLLGVLRDMINTVKQFCMQSTIDAQYIIRLGADPRLVIVTGNTKFDQNYTELSGGEKEELQKEIGLLERDPLIVAGSTHKVEEELLFNAFRTVKNSLPKAALIVAPREIQRTPDIVELAVKHGFSVSRRTLLKDTDAEAYDVVILDTIGELGKFYGLGDVIYVGGTLVTHGGHNILEPAAHGKPILVGPNMFNFKDTYALFSERKACITVYDTQSLAEQMLLLLMNPKLRQEMSREALDIIRENKGASKRTFGYIKEILTAGEQGVRGTYGSNERETREQPL